MSKPILCLDFDGVIHSYTSQWNGAHRIPDPPVPGAMAFLVKAVQHFQVSIFSTRSHQDDGIIAMRRYIEHHLDKEFGEGVAFEVTAALQFPIRKPPAKVSIDDRGLTFTGEWPSIESLLAFKPWNKRDAPPPSGTVYATNADGDEFAAISTEAAIKGLQMAGYHVVYVGLGKE